LSDQPRRESLVLDASALTEVLTGTATGRAVARRMTGPRLVAPDIIDVEVASALRRQHLWGSLDAERLRTGLDLLLDWPGTRVPSRMLVRTSRRWWGNVSPYDALYLAVAHAAEASVVTCDGRLARAPGTGVPIEHVRVT